jgi:tetratricopeptide (TPR) repeat protein
VLLQVLDSRDDIQDAATIEWLLSCLEATWLFTDKNEEAIIFFSEYISRYPNDSTAYWARAASLWYLGQLQEAIRDYSRALELKPTDILSLCGRGQVLAEVGQGKEAMKDLNLALEELKTAPRSGPDFTEWREQAEAFTRNGRAVALATLGESAAAMEEFDASLALSPENAWVYYNRAHVHDLAGNREKARSDYQIALTKTGPPLSPFRKSRAQVWLQP